MGFTMTAREMVSLFRARGPSRGPWRARCPVHKSRSLTLSIYAGPDRTTVHCFAGCDADDVLAAVGLTWKDCYYQPRTKLDAKSQAEARRKREADELRASNLRIGTWILRFIENGYTREDRDSDMMVVAVCAIVLSNHTSRHWEHILRTHMERISAANHCMERRILPAVARGRVWTI